MFEINLPQNSPLATGFNEGAQTATRLAELPSQLNQLQAQNNLLDIQTQAAKNKLALMQKYPLMQLTSPQAQTMTALQMLNDAAPQGQISNSTNSTNSTISPQSYIVASLTKDLGNRNLSALKSLPDIIKKQLFLNAEKAGYPVEQLPNLAYSGELFNIKGNRDLLTNQQSSINLPNASQNNQTNELQSSIQRDAIGQAAQKRQQSAAAMMPAFNIMKKTYGDAAHYAGIQGKAKFYAEKAFGRSNPTYQGAINYMIASNNLINNFASAIGLPKNSIAYQRLAQEVDMINWHKSPQIARTQFEKVVTPLVEAEAKIATMTPIEQQKYIINALNKGKGSTTSNFDSNVANGMVRVVIPAGKNKGKIGLISAQQAQDMGINPVE